MNDFFQIISLQEFFFNLQNSMVNLIKEMNYKNHSLNAVNKIINSVNSNIFKITIENFGSNEIVRDHAYKLKYVVLDNEDVFVVRCSTELENAYNHLGIQPISYIFNKE